MASRFRVWLRRRVKLRGQTHRRDTRIAGSDPQTAASSTGKDSPPPPPYTTLPKTPTTTHQHLGCSDGSESIEVLRARNPPTQPRSAAFPILHQPTSTITLHEAAKAAATQAVIGTLGALEESNPRMVAARTAQAISAAVSTSRSYAAFIAAVTAVESSALLLLENDRDELSPGYREVRQANAIRAAAYSAMVADAGVMPVGPWPFNVYDGRPQEFSSRKESCSSSAN